MASASSGCPPAAPALTVQQWPGYGAGRSLHTDRLITGVRAWRAARPRLVLCLAGSSPGCGACQTVRPSRRAANPRLKDPPVKRSQRQRSSTGCLRRTFGTGGGARRVRTADLLNAIQALSQLSYGPGTPVSLPVGKTLGSRRYSPRGVARQVRSRQQNALLAQAGEQRQHRQAKDCGMFSLDAIE